MQLMDLAQLSTLAADEDIQQSKFYDFENSKKDFLYNRIQNKLLNKTFCDYAQDIKFYLEENYKKRVRNYTIAAKCLIQLEDENKIALIAVKAIFSCLHKSSTNHKVIKTIADALNNENLCIQLSKKNKKLYDKLSSDYSSLRMKTYFKVDRITKTFKKEEGFEPIHWSESQKMFVGLVLLEMFWKYGYIEKKIKHSKNKMQFYVSPSLKMIDLVRNINYDEDLFFSLEPTLYKPINWTSSFNGGYNDEWIDTFIRGKNDSYLKLAEKKGLDNYFNAVNVIQSVPWKINENILNVVNMILKNNIEIGGIPSSQEFVLRDNPYPYNPNKKLTQEQLKEVSMWKQECLQITDEAIKNRSKCFLISRIVNLAKKYNNKIIYFPHNLDFRGRMYPMAAELQPQGCDLAKSLLKFSEGKLLDENGVKWLKIHIANMWGFSKKSYEERIKWVNGYIIEMFKYTENPLVYTEWKKADKPFQFLAGCFELLGYIKNPDYFISTLPIYTDGTCNGLQHYSALLEDSIGGKSVNLLPDNKPNDLYQEVADCLIKKLKKIDDEDLAKLWLSFGIDRNLTKKPVMTLVYGAVKYTCKEDIKKYLLENYDHEYIHRHFGEIGIAPYSTINKVSNWLGERLWQTIEECIPSAIQTMEYIKKITAITVKNQKNLEWYTPMGMLVNQRYINYGKSRIKTHVMGNLKTLLYKKELCTTNKIKHKNAICPNFIHSLDASCLILWILRCEENNIQQMSAVHDSYGVLASDMELSQKILRDAFVETYTSYNILEKFVEDITCDLSEKEKLKLPKPLPMGDLNLHDIKDSDYFFS